MLDVQGEPSGYHWFYIFIKAFQDFSMTVGKLTMFSSYISLHFCSKALKNLFERTLICLKNDKKQIFGTTQIAFPSRDVNVHIRILCLTL